MGQSESKKKWWIKGSKVPQRDDKQVYVKDFADLPKEVQKMVVTIPRELMDANFEILLTTVRFVTRRTIKRQKYVQDKIQQQQERERASASTASQTDPDHEHQTSVQEELDENESISVDFSASASVDGNGNSIRKPPVTRTNTNMSIDAMSEQLIDKTQNARKLFKIVKTAGKGGFARVYKAKDLTGKKGKVAIKKLPNKTPHEKRANVDEIYWLKNCVHDNIVKYYAAYEVKDEIWISMEFMDGGTLGEAVKSCIFEENQIAFVARECLKGLKFLHSQGIIHRDMKSGNIMMTTEGTIKLIDFGLCCHMSADRKCMVGSPYWIPPEMVLKQEHSTATDIWSTGICMLEMAYGQPPEKDSPIKCMFMSAIGKPPRLQDENQDEWSAQFRDFISKMLEVNQHKRASADQLLEHPFIATADTQASMKHIIEHIFIEKGLFEHSGMAA